MEELSIEEKAKRYNEVSQEVKGFFEGKQKMNSDVTKTLEHLFPELKESEDERMRERILAGLIDCRDAPDLGWSDFGGIPIDHCIAWLEKQGEVDKTHYDIAEKEKYDFVSGQYIECRKSFDIFKEDNSYWFEYIGNDNYIGRSDNILNQKFHITPKQLFCLFTQQHCPKENNVNEETNAPTEYGKYVDECLNKAAKHFFSEGEDKYSVADLFYAGIKCKENWLEKQGEQKPNPYSGVSFEYNGHTWGMCARDGGVDIDYDKQLIANINPIREKDEFDNLNKAIDNKDIGCNTGDFIMLTAPNHGV